MSTTPGPAAALDAVVREEWGRLTALLLARYRRLDLVEDALGDAVESAAKAWLADGVPANPSAWLLTAARRRVLDQLRHESVRERTRPVLVADARLDQEGARTMADPGDVTDPVEDDLLRLVLMCTHPALAREGASALALRLVLGVRTPDIARLFLVTEPTMAARITRAKRRIAGAGIPFAVPGADVLPERLDGVAQTGYLAFTAGYVPGTGADLVRAELAGEAVRLVRVVLGLRPDEPVLLALLALMLFQHSRRDARVQDRRLVLLPDQDRGRWHHSEIAEARRLLGHPKLAGPLTPQAAAYTLQARIAAEHALPAAAGDTDWSAVTRLYDVLLQVAPTPGARLARAVAVAEEHGPVAGLAALEGIEIATSHRVDSVRAELLRRAGENDSARAAYDQAIAACGNDVEREHLTRMRGSL